MWEWPAPGQMGMWTTQTGRISGLLRPQPLHGLQRLQALREGQAVPPPAVVDVDVSVAGPIEADKAIPAH